MTDLQWMRPRLAELCGLHRRGGDYVDGPTDYALPVFSVDQQHPMDGVQWRPDEDVAQAVRCLNATGFQWEITREAAGHMVRLWPSELHLPRVKTTQLPKTLEHTIVLAIAAALGWTQGDEGGGG